MKKLSVAILTSAMLFTSLSFAEMDDDRMEGEHERKHEMRGDFKKEMEEKKAKIKEICKTDKEKCKAIKELRKKHKSEMDALVESAK